LVLFGKKCVFEKKQNFVVIKVFGFEKWTFLKCPKCPKCKKSWKKGCENVFSYHNALVFKNL
jgi:hypothetical protein